MRKTISPVIVLALFIVIAITASIGFQGWFSDFSSNLYSDVEQEDSRGFYGTGVEKVIGNSLYMTNRFPGNVSVDSVVLANRTCLSNVTITKGTQKITLPDSCIAEVAEGRTEVVIYTDKGVFSKYVYLKGYKASSSSTSVLDTFTDETDWKKGVFNTTEFQQGYLRMGVDANSISGEVAYWRLDAPVSGDGGIVTDSVGNNAGETKNGVNSGIPGILGSSSFSFDGSDDEILINSSLPNLENWTVSGWIKPDDWSNSARKEWFSVTEDRSTDKPLDFVHEGGMIKHYRGDAAGQVMSHDVSGLSGWHHVSVTQERKGPSQVDVVMYLDGVQVDSASGNYEDMRPSLEMKIGNIAKSTTYFNFAGEIDEVRLFNRSFSPAEVRRLYLYGKPFTGSYERVITNQEMKDWKKVMVNASIPAQTSLSMRFRTFDEKSKYYGFNTSASWNQGTGNNTFIRDDSVRIGYPSSSGISGLVGYWPFNTDANPASDQSGMGNDGALQNGVTSNVSGILGLNASGFDGSDDYINVSDSASLDIQTAITLSAWIKADGTQPEAAAGIITKDDLGSKRSYNLHLSSATSPNPWALRMRLLGLSGSDTVDGTTDLRDNTWHHVAGTWNGTRLRVYVDGQLENEVNGTGSILTRDTDVHIGNFGDNRFHLDGKIDEARMYNRSLSAEEIKDLYFDGVPFQAEYTSSPINNSEEVNWEYMLLNTSIPSGLNLSATFRAFDDTTVIESQSFDLSDGFQNLTLDVSASPDAQIFISGETGDIEKSWELHDMIIATSLQENITGESFSVMNGTYNYSIDSGATKQGEIIINGTSSDILSTWNIQDLRLYMD